MLSIDDNQPGHGDHDPTGHEQALFAALEAQMVNGRTQTVIDAEQANAEAAMLLELDDPEVLAARREAAKAAELDRIATAGHLAALDAQGERARAERTARVENRRAQRAENAENTREDRAQAAEDKRADAVRNAENAYLARQAATDPNLKAASIERRKPMVVTVFWVALVLGLIYTGAHVQSYLAQGAPQWSMKWLSGWGVDGILALPIIMVLVIESHIGHFDVLTTKRKAFYIGAEIISLGAALALNLAPDIKAGAAFEDMLPHIIVPGWTLFLAVLLTLTQDRYRRAVAVLDDAGRRGPTVGLTGPEYSGNTDETTTQAVSRVRAAIADGSLPGDASAHAIRKTLGIGMNTARKVRDRIRSQH